MSGFANLYCSLSMNRASAARRLSRPDQLKSIAPRQLSRLRSEINSPDLSPWLFLRAFRALALRAIRSPTFFPNVALSNGAISFAAPNKATSRFTLAGCFDGEIPRRCGMGSPLYPQRLTSLNSPGSQMWSGTRQGAVLFPNPWAGAINVHHFATPPAR
jgi:hypothetical protein